jgi:hypothetical protein
MCHFSSIDRSHLCSRQRIDIDFERTDVKSRFNWINRAAIHYLNKTAFWNLAQYKYRHVLVTDQCYSSWHSSDFVLLYSAMSLDNSEHIHFRHTDYYALACSYLSMALVNQVVHRRNIIDILDICVYRCLFQGTL